MKNRFTEEGPGPLPSQRDDTRAWLTLLLGLALAVAMLAAPQAGAQEPPRAPQAQDPEPREAEPEPPPASGIEEIVVLGSESEATRDFEAADSVTGFGAEDLAALGVQDISDLASFTPNLEIVTSGATTPTFFIRGVGLNDFNANSTGSVAIYRDDVAINAPALQLGSLFDVEAVNVLRGPQGTGPARNASAGAIKMYSRKPTGNFGGFLRADAGNFNALDFEGAVEAPVFEDLLAGRFAFRFSERDGTMKNRCADADAYGDRVRGPTGRDLFLNGNRTTDPPWSQCGEAVAPSSALNDSFSEIPEGLPSRINDIGNWAARGTLLFQPTLDMSWLLSAHGARRDEWTRLGQSFGTRGFYCLDGPIEDCFESPTEFPEGTRMTGVLGGFQGRSGSGDYQPVEVQQRLQELAPCLTPVVNPDGTLNHTAPGVCQLFLDNGDPVVNALVNAAKVTMADELAQGLDSDPWAGDFNFCSADQDVDGDPSNGIQCDEHTGRTTNDSWGAYVKGDIVLPWGIQLISVTGYDTYDRLIDNDLDFSPETLFHIRTDDEGWQAVQDLRLQGQVGDEYRLLWEVGGWFLREQLDVDVRNDLGDRAVFGVGQRQYTQDVFSAAGYLSLAFDFWEHFTLDGGFRYNWERKKLDYLLSYETFDPLTPKLNDVWQAPTGTVRLTYRFRDDTHLFGKYTRGWKPGTYNATSALLFPAYGGELQANISVAEPETVDAFEAGVRGSWLEGRLRLDFSFFYYSYSDYQLFTAQQFSGAQPEFVILNAESAEVYGAELDAKARPWNGAYLNARIGWLETQFLDFVQLQQEIVFVPGSGLQVVSRELQNTGNPLLNSPRFKISLTAEQTLPLGRWGSVSARYDGVWTDTTYYDATQGRGIPNRANNEFLPEDTIGQPPFWVHNLRLAYRPPGLRLELAAWARNLTNQVYKNFAFDGSTFNQTTIFAVGDPRTFGGSLVINF